jgi:ABC-type sugar transport system permease subunit
MTKSTHPMMPLWQRLLITIVAMLVVSFVVGLIWKWLFNAALPDFLGGLVGGMAALPVWEFMKRVNPK